MDGGVRVRIWLVGLRFRVFLFQLVGGIQARVLFGSGDLGYSFNWLVVLCLELCLVGGVRVGVLFSWWDECKSFVWLVKLG